jgi:hypothetical protein
MDIAMDPRPFYKNPTGGLDHNPIIRYVSSAFIKCLEALL